MKGDEPQGLRLDVSRRAEIWIFVGPHFPWSSCNRPRVKLCPIELFSVPTELLKQACKGLVACCGACCLCGDC